MRRSLNQFPIGSVLAAFVAALIAASPATAQLFRKPRECQNCVPWTPLPYHEVMPTTPDTLPKKDKDTPESAPAPTPDIPPMAPGFDPGASVAGLGETAAVPNIFGSQFGRGGTQSSVSVVQPGLRSGSTVMARFKNATESPPGEFNVSAGAPLILSMTGFSSINTVSPENFSIDGFPAGGGTIQVFPGSPPLTFQQISALLIQQGEADLIPLAAQLFQLANAAEMSADPNATLLGVGIGPVDATATPTNSFDLLFSTMLQTIVSTQMFFDVPSPAAGGVVGRTQIAENNNPLPQDRVFFNYDYFDNVPLTRNGVDVNRFVFGVEKTFFDQMASVQMRLPFAGTLDSTHRIGSGDRNTELGNLHFLLKVLLMAGPRGAISTGMGISAPTADDTRVRLGNLDAVRIENEAVLLSPFIAAMVTPTERTFAQFWTSFDFDANGNPVYANPTLTPGGLHRVGRLRDQTLMIVSGQVGAWIYQSQNRSAFVRAIAPFMELHYIAGLGNPDVVRSGNFFVGNLSGDFDELNLTTGVLADLGPRSTFSLGVVSPLRSGNDRTFDYQIGVRLNVFFGPTLNSRANRFTPFTF